MVPIDAVVGMPVGRGRGRRGMGRREARERAVVPSVGMGVIARGYGRRRCFGHYCAAGSCFEVFALGL